MIRIYTQNSGIHPRLPSSTCLLTSRLGGRPVLLPVDGGSALDARLTLDCPSAPTGAMCGVELVMRYSGLQGWRCLGSYCRQFGMVSTMEPSSLLCSHHGICLRCLPIVTLLCATQGALYLIIVRSLLECILDSRTSRCVLESLPNLLAKSSVPSLK